MEKKIVREAEGTKSWPYTLAFLQGPLFLINFICIK